MMKQRIRDLLDATPFKPFTISMADGKSYKVDHPDFVLSAPNMPDIHVQDLGGHLHTLSAQLVTSVEVENDPSVV